MLIIHAAFDHFGLPVYSARGHDFKPIGRHSEKTDGVKRIPNPKPYRNFTGNG
jgi:hypothetical protein